MVVGDEVAVGDEVVVDDEVVIADEVIFCDIELVGEAILLEAVLVAKNFDCRLNASASEILAYGLSNFVLQRLIAGPLMQTSYWALQHHPMSAHLVSSQQTRLRWDSYSSLRSGRTTGRCRRGSQPRCRSVPNFRIVCARM